MQKFIFLIGICIFFFSLNFVFANQIYVDPISNSVNSGDVFSVNVIGNVTAVSPNLYGVQYSIDFDPNILSFVFVSEGNLLNNDGVQTTVFKYTLSTGKVSIYNVRNSTIGITKDGVLATFNFRATTGGISPLNLNDVVWISSSITNTTVQIITPTITNGSVSVTGSVGAGGSGGGGSSNSGSVLESIPFGNIIENIVGVENNNGNDTPEPGFLGESSNEDQGGNIFQLTGRVAGEFFSGKQFRFFIIYFVLILLIIYFAVLLLRRFFSRKHHKY